MYSRLPYFAVGTQPSLSAPICRMSSASPEARGPKTYHLFSLAHSSLDALSSQPASCRQTRRSTASPLSTARPRWAQTQVRELDCGTHCPIFGSYSSFVHEAGSSISVHCAYFVFIGAGFVTYSDHSSLSGTVVVLWS